MDGDRIHVVYNGIPEIHADRELRKTEWVNAPPFRGSCGPDAPYAGLGEISRPSPWPDVIYERWSVAAGTLGSIGAVVYGAFLLWMLWTLFVR